MIIINDNNSEMLLSCQSYKLINTVLNDEEIFFVVDCSKSLLHQSFSDRMPLYLHILPSVDQVKGNQKGYGWIYIQGKSN